VFPLGTSAAAAAPPGGPLAIDGAMVPAACEKDCAMDVSDDGSSAAESDMDAGMLSDGDTHLHIQGVHTVIAYQPLRMHAHMPLSHPKLCHCVLLARCSVGTSHVQACISL
jgi:hypothetical protein